MGIFEPINSPEYSAFKSMITPFSLKPNLPKWKSSLTPKMMEQLGQNTTSSMFKTPAILTPYMGDARGLGANVYNAVQNIDTNADSVNTQDPFAAIRQEVAPTQEVTSNSPSEYESGILEQSKRQNDLLLQAANNAYANQERNAQNQVINYNNNQQAQMNRTANSMSSGSFTPTYQQAVYTPQSMNFGTQQQAPAMSFGSVPTEGLPRGGTINGVPVFGKQGERLNVSMDTLRQAGTDMQKKNQFVDANNQLQTKQVKGGFTTNNINSTAMNNIGKYMPSITAPKKQLSQTALVGLTANEDNSLPVSMTIPYTQPKNIKGPVSYNPAMDFASNQNYSRGY